MLYAYLHHEVSSAVVAPVLAQTLHRTAQTLRAPLTQIPSQERAAFRSLCLLESRCLAQWESQRRDPVVGQCARSLETFVEYVSTWIKVAVALALGLGTMVGWKRIVVTVGEKIGKTHLSYAQGVSAQLVATATILLADVLKLPVSTTHVLSSGVAGSMYAQKSGLQSRTLLLIGSAWVLTLPVCMTLGLGLFLIFLGVFQP
jgi:phosphate/sulfate permease